MSNILNEMQNDDKKVFDELIHESNEIMNQLTSIFTEVSSTDQSVQLNTIKNHFSSMIVS